MKALLLVLACQVHAMAMDDFAPFGKPDASVEESSPGVWKLDQVSPKASEALAGLRATNSEDLPAGRYAIEAAFRVMETPFADDLGYAKLMAGPLDRTQPWTVDFPIAAGRQWQTFQVPFRLREAVPAGQFIAQAVSAHPGQVSEWRDVRIRRLEGADDVPLPPPSGLTYPGREPEADWRTQARERIEQIRKADLSIRLLDAKGNPVVDAEVALHLERHAFPFGTAVSATRLLGESPDDERYRKEFLRLFNAAVLENDLKWPALDGDWQGNPPDQTLRALRWLKDHHIPVRGHTLVWGSRQHLPRSVGPLLDDPTALQERILTHIRDTATLTRGLIAEWDVVNEPREHNQVYGLLGPGAAADWFRAARESAPDAKLFLNEFDLLVTRTALHPNHRAFLDYIAALRRDGAPIDGIGEQAHIWNIPPPPAHVLRVLDLLATTGLPLVITEYDFAPGDEALQADYTRDFLLAAFSHPAVEGIYLWGFWDGAHWRPNAGLFRKDWSERLQLRAFEQLVKDEWSPQLHLKTDASGVARFRGFPGEYQARLSGGSCSTIDLKKDHPTATISLAP